MRSFFYMMESYYRRTSLAKNSSIACIIMELNCNIGDVIDKLQLLCYFYMSVLSLCWPGGDPRAHVHAEYERPHFKTQA